ncbi:MAG: hypothetical protein JWM19_965 [Actinomycetia bacterium]|nr:hypothetical protein [Actinomycetes bacterium]
MPVLAGYPFGAGVRLPWLGGPRASQVAPCRARVGTAGFEPAASRSRSARASQAAPCPGSVPALRGRRPLGTCKVLLPFSRPLAMGTEPLRPWRSQSRTGISPRGVTGAVLSSTQGRVLDVGTQGLEPRLPAPKAGALTLTRYPVVRPTCLREAPAGTGSCPRPGQGKVVSSLILRCSPGCTCRGLGLEHVEWRGVPARTLGCRATARHVDHSGLEPDASPLRGERSAR